MDEARSCSGSTGSPGAGLRVQRFPLSLKSSVVNRGSTSSLRRSTLDFGLVVQAVLLHLVRSSGFRGSDFWFLGSSTRFEQEQLVRAESICFRILMS